MAVIRILDKHTAELIAAGEVVERPASVVKELLENAIDAGASQITVSIRRGGIQEIEISDNGTGIQREFVPTAFVRHATSKIIGKEDLDSIGTLGFRGEALASIASVSKVQLLTCTKEDEYACCYRIEGGEEISMEPAARPVGTTITIRDLFYNTPARMKFLKKDSSEGTFVSETIRRLALSNPNIQFKFIREGNLMFGTAGRGKLVDTMYTILGDTFTKELLPVEAEIGAYHVSGFVTPARACRASRSMQYFYINGRFVKNRTILSALEAAYKGSVMKGKFPGGVLELTMPLDLVDVNVHPAKTEVRFAREQEVFDVVYKAVKLALAIPQSVQEPLYPSYYIGKKSIENTAEPILSIVEKESVKQQPKPAQQNQSKNQPILQQDAKVEVEKKASEPKIFSSQDKVVITTCKPESFSDFRSCSLPYTVQQREPELDIEVEAEEIQQEEPKESSVPEPLEESVPESQQTAFLQTETDQILRIVGEVFDTYIIAQRGNDMCLIDKHAAHERILYEKLKNTVEESAGQLLLQPVSILVSAEEKNILLQASDLLKKQGVEIEDFGDTTILVRSVPADIETGDIDTLIQELAEGLMHNPRQPTSEKREWVVHSIACRAAVKARDTIHQQEMLHLAKEILEGNIPLFCPHGRPVVLKLTKKELEKQFGRQG